MFLLKEPERLSCGNDITITVPQWNTTALTDDDLETCENSATGLRHIYYLVKSSFKNPIITVIGNFTCSPNAGMSVTISLQCKGDSESVSKCLDTRTCTPLVDLAEINKERFHCEFTCGTQPNQWIKIDSILVNLPTDDATICEISLL